MVTAIAAFASPVLATAADVLTADSFVIERVELEAQVTPPDIRDPEPSLTSAEALLAEDPYFVLLVVAGSTLEELETLESTASAHLATRLTERPLGDKAWDGYVILLAQERLQDVDDTTGVYDLLYDMSNVRRIVGLGIKPHPDSLRQALRPFLRLERLEVREVLTDVFDDLVDALATEGIDRGDATAAISEFRRRLSHG
jgi:hypothetical protein